MSFVTDLLSLLVVPSGIAGALFVAGLCAGIWPAARRYSWGLLAAAGGIALVFSTGPVAALLIHPLEYEYEAVHDGASRADARFIVVLTGWAADDEDMPLSGRVNDSSAYRLLMTLQLFDDRPDCTVVVSGAPATARIMGEILVKLGVPSARLIVEDASATTADSAANLQAIVGTERFFLVSSAGHLPRAMSAMEARSLRPVPVPTDHKMPKDWTRASWTPSPMHLVIADLAAHEYVGRLWYWLSGRS